MFICCWKLFLVGVEYTCEIDIDESGCVVEDVVKYHGEHSVEYRTGSINHGRFFALHKVWFCELGDGMHITR